MWVKIKLEKSILPHVGPSILSQIVEEKRTHLAEALPSQVQNTKEIFGEFRLEMVNKEKK